MTIVDKTGQRHPSSLQEEPPLEPTGRGNWAWAARMASFILVAALCLMVRNTPPGYAKGLSESQVKAAFVYNFAKFVEWPAQAFPDSSSPFVVGVIGDTRFAEAVEQMSKGKTVNGRRMVTRRLSADGSMENCHLLFITADQKRQTGRVLEKVKDSSVLTVGESDGFVQSGGIIGFVVQDNKIGFEVNAGAAKRKRLKISSQLLKLARTVRD